MEKKEIRIFISYSSRDRDLREMLETGLKPHLAHRKEFYFSLWSDTGIDIGANWKESIDKAMENSQAALLLVSANFAASKFISEVELGEFFKRKGENGYLIFPVLAREYTFRDFEEISSLNFFKTYYSEYGFNKPLERHKLLSFDKLVEDEKTTEGQLNLYFKNLADFIYNAVKNVISI